MPRRPLRALLALLAGAALIVGSAGTAQVAQAAPTYGPPYDFQTELMGDGAGLSGNGVIPLKNQAMITRHKNGYRYRAGQQDGHLVITRVKAGLRFVDKGTRRWRSLAGACKRQRVKVGIAAVCTMPPGFSKERPLLLEVWPRDGDDVTDGRTLPATIAMAVLADTGRDVTRTGAGPDFINSAQHRDRAYGGAGNDWIRGGADNDTLHGGPGHDYLVSTHGRDRLFGGRGDDKLRGGDSADRLYAGPGRDDVGCGNGIDFAKVDDDDRHNACEQVARR